MSVVEMVRLTSVAGRGDEFADRLRAGLQVQGQDPECLSISLLRSIERPDEYMLTLTWTSVEAHHAWRDANRDRWRAAVGWEIVEGGPQGLGHYSFVAQVKE